MNSVKYSLARKFKSDFFSKFKLIFFFSFLIFSQQSFAVKGTVLGTAKQPIPGDDNDINLVREWSAVGTGPYFGLGATYDGSDLVVLQPNIHKDLALLKQNTYISKVTKDRVAPAAPYVQLSGLTEIQMTAQSKTRNAVDLTMANLDIDAWVNPWLTAYANFGIESDEAKNGNFRMIQAFATYGNLMQSPIYASIGQMFVPFGSFSTGTSEMGSVTRSVGRIYERAFSAGYYPGNGMHLSGAVYNGRTRNSRSRNLDQFATSARYEGDILILNSTPASFKAGVSYTNNIAETAVMREMFNEGAVLSHFVPGADLFLQFKVLPYVFRAEYVSALRHFSENDIMQGPHKIKPSSLLLEVEYDFYMFGKAAAVTLHHSEADDAVASSLVKHQAGVNTSVNILKNTLLSLEYSHRRIYSSKNAVSNVPVPDRISPLNATNVGMLNASLNDASKNMLVATLDIFY